MTRPVPVADPRILLAWTPHGLPPGLAGRVRLIPGVARVVAVTSGLAWLTRTTSSTGVVVDRPPPGFAIPVEVTAAEPGAFAPFLSPSERAQLVPVARGEGWLGASSAMLRRLGPGGALWFGSRAVVVSSVVPDEAIGAAELFVSPVTARSLGVTRQRYLLIALRPGASAERLVASVRAAVPRGTPVRIRGAGETTYFRQGDGVLAPVQLKQLFGEFAARRLPGGRLQVDPAWAATHLVTRWVPLLGRITCSRAVLGQLVGALDDLQRQGLASLVHRGPYDGCFAPQLLDPRDPTGGLSHHTWGVAIDLHLGDNPVGKVPHQDPRVVAVFERWGFTWGGSWPVPDGKHFEFVRVVPSG